MKTVTIAVLLCLTYAPFTVSSVSSGITALPFRCQIYGCAEGGTCDYETGNCNCADDGKIYNYNCAHYAVTGSCSDCDADGLADIDAPCRSDDDGECMCAQDSYDDCENKRVTAICGGISNEHPVLEFRAFMHHHPNNHVTYYIHANFDDSSAFEDEICQWTDQANGLHTYVTEAVAPIGECKQLVVDGGEFYTYVYVQYNPLYRSPLDQLIKFTCFDGVRPNSPSWDITVSDPTSATLDPLESTVDTGDNTGTTMMLVEEQEGGSFQVISDAQQTIEIGHDLSLVLINEEPFVVKYCTVTNYAADDDFDDADFKELKLIDDGCVPADAVALMRRAVYHGDGLTDNGADSSQTLFRVDFDAFAFIGPSKKLFISCALCLNHCEMSTTPICNTGFISYAEQMETAFPDDRRRRDVGDDVRGSNNSSMFTRDGMEVSIEIGSRKNQEVQASSSNESSAGSCYKSVSVLLPLSLLFVLLVVAMLMVFFFSRKLTAGPVVKPTPPPTTFFSIADHSTKKSCNYN